MENFKLNKKVKEKWVEALSSGKYKQGIELLRTVDNHFCCLGVACEIGITKEHKIFYTTNCSLKFLPQLIQDKLSDFNDSGKSFNWIAYYIERYL